jgi:hypothetical protein
MKQLIKSLSYAICMLLPVFVFCDAQAHVKDTLYQVTCEGDTTGRYFVFEHGQMPPKYATQNIMQLMFEYEKECATDSIIYGCTIEYKNDTLPDNLGGYTIIVGQKLVNVYMPKEPTFKDFVRWVRKKYCK